MLTCPIAHQMRRLLLPLPVTRAFDSFAVNGNHLGSKLLHQASDPALKTSLKRFGVYPLKHSSKGIPVWNTVGQA